MKHSSIIGGSSAKRRLHCTGSAALEAQFPERGDKSIWSREGDALHDLLYKALVEHGSPVQGEPVIWVDPEDGVEVPLSAEKLDQAYWPVYRAVVDLCSRHRIESYDVELTYAHKKTCGDDVFGTLDFVGRSKDGYLVVVDFKFGQGVKEHARENYQLGFYTLGLWENEDPFAKDLNKVVFVIIQPFRDDDENIVDEWETDMWWLESLRRREAKAYRDIKSGRTSLKVGDYCQFCRARAVCPEQNDNLETFQMSAPPPELEADMTVLRLAELLEMGERAKAQYDALVKYATRIGEEGTKIPGYKIIESRGNRRYKDERTAAMQAASVIGSEATETKLKSPRQLEAAFKRLKEDFSVMDAHIERPIRGGRLVRDTNPAPQITAATDMDLPINVTPLRGKKK